jgi:hypothetical protein
VRLGSGKACANVRHAKKLLAYPFTTCVSGVGNCLILATLRSRNSCAALAIIGEIAFSIVLLLCVLYALNIYCVYAISDSNVEDVDKKWLKKHQTGKP